VLADGRAREGLEVLEARRRISGGRDTVVVLERAGLAQAVAMPATVEPFWPMAT